MFYLMLAFMFFGFLLLAFVSTRDDLSGRLSACQEFQDACMSELAECRLGAVQGEE